MLHVGMDIPDKAALFAEMHRVLRPRGTFAIYDIMRLTDAPLAYPVPWAQAADDCAIATPETYRAGLQNAGFEVLTTQDRTAYAAAFSQL